MPPEVEEQEQIEAQDFFEDTTEVAEELPTEEVVETEPEPEPTPDRSEELMRQNQELQRRIVDFMESQKPKPPAPKGVDLRERLAQRFDEKTANNLAEFLSEYEEVLASKFAQKEELNRFSGTLAHLARNADEARVFEDFRRQGVADEDIREARKMVDHLVENEGAYFPNAQIAMDAAYGRLRRQRAQKTAGATTAARATKTANRSAADMGASRGGGGVPVITNEEKQAAYEMDTADFLDWLDKKAAK